MSLNITFKGSSDLGRFSNEPICFGVDDTPAATEFVNLQAASRAFGGKTANWSPFTFAVAEAINDFVAIGLEEYRFGKVYFHLNSAGTQGAGGVVSWQYWNGSTWGALTVVDGTSGFTSADTVQILKITVPSDWAKTTVNGVNGYWIRAIITTVYSTNPDYTGIRITDFRDTNMYLTEVWGVDDTPASTEFVDYTTQARDDDNANYTPFTFAAAEASGDWAAWGCHQQFSRMRVDDANGTQGAGGTGVFEYWSSASGGSWQTLTVGTDDTSGFTSAVGDDKIIDFTVPGDWVKRTINGGASLYFIRFRLTAAFTTNPVLDQMMVQRLNLLIPVDPHDDLDFVGGGEPLRDHTGTSAPRDFADEDPGATVLVEVDSLITGITLAQEHDVNFDVEIVSDSGVIYTLNASPDSNGITTVNVSIAVASAAALFARMVLDDGSNPGEVKLIIQRTHTVAVQGVAIQGIESPSTSEGLANFAQMYFGNSATADNYMPVNGYHSSTTVASRNVLTEGVCPIDGTISIIIIGSNADFPSVEIYVAGASQGRFVAVTLGGDEEDHYSVFRVGIAVTKGQRIAVQNRDAHGTAWCQLWITPTDGSPAPYQLAFGGDMDTASECMQFMGEPDDIGIAPNSIRCVAPTPFSGVITEVILGREIAGSVFQLRINGVLAGDTFSDDGVNTISPIAVAEGSLVQVQCVTGAGAQNRCHAYVNIQPDETSLTGVMIPFLGTASTDYINRCFGIHFLAVLATTTVGVASKFLSPRKLTVKRFAGVADGSALEVSVGVDQTWVNASCNDVVTQSCSIVDLLSSEGGMPWPKNSKAVIAQKLGGNTEAAILLYAD